MKPDVLIYSLLADKGIPVEKFVVIKNMVDAYDSPVYALHSDNFIKALRDAFPLPYDEDNPKQISASKIS